MSEAENYLDDRIQIGLGYPTPGSERDFELLASTDSLGGFTPLDRIVPGLPEQASTSDIRREYSSIPVGILATNMSFQAAYSGGIRNSRG